MYPITKQQKIARHEAAKARLNTRTPEQQIQALDKRLGINKGASKERARLNNLINTPNTTEA